MEPLCAMHQLLQHVLPAYLQKTRRYGLHHSSTRKRLAHVLTNLVRQNGQTIRTVMQIIKDLMGVEQITSEHCGGTAFSITPIPADRTYLCNYLTKPHQPP